MLVLVIVVVVAGLTGLGVYLHMKQNPSMLSLEESAKGLLIKFGNLFKSKE